MNWAKALVRGAVLGVIAEQGLHTLSQRLVRIEGTERRDIAVELHD